MRGWCGEIEEQKGKNQEGKYTAPQLSSRDYTWTGDKRSLTECVQHASRQNVLYLSRGPKSGPLHCQQRHYSGLGLKALPQATVLNNQSMNKASTTVVAIIYKSFDNAWLMRWGWSSKGEDLREDTQEVHTSAQFTRLHMNWPQTIAHDRVCTTRQ